MKKKFIIINTIIVVIALLLMFALGVTVTKSEHIDRTKEQIVEITRIYKDNYTSAENIVKKSNENIRVTVIDSAGNVIADSDEKDLSKFDNHIDREEIVAAREDKPKVVSRDSDTVGVTMLYYAEKISDSDSPYGYVFLRVAIPVASVNSYIAKSIPLSLTIVFFAAVLSFVAYVIMAGELFKPLEKVKQSLEGLERGEFKRIEVKTSDADADELLSGINDVADKLEESIKQNEEEKKKLDYILNNVSDAIVVCDEGATVRAINSAAKKIFGLQSAEGKTIEAVTGSREFCAAVKRCVTEKKDGFAEVEIDSRYFLCTVKNTESGLTIAVLSDVTDSKTSEKTRLEFFANASHELKTPLTAIKGFNELIGMNAKGEIKEYSEKIEKETQRMLSLINDMLNLNKLENSSVNAENLTPVSVGDAMGEAASELSVLAKSKNVTINVSGDAKLKIEKEHLYELVKNLIENAVRYNVEGGSVDASVKRENGKTVVSVSDTGIGIDAESRSRIFERFYRVDKSRSRATGGTGLGLAIVKHVCELYGARIDLSSRLGVGTVITVTFD